MTDRIKGEPLSRDFKASHESSPMSAVPTPPATPPTREELDDLIRDVVQTPDATPELSEALDRIYASLAASRVTTPPSEPRCVDHYCQHDGDHEGECACRCGATATKYNFDWREPPRPPEGTTPAKLKIREAAWDEQRYIQTRYRLASRACVEKGHTWSVKEFVDTPTLGQLCECRTVAWTSPLPPRAASTGDTTP